MTTNLESEIVEALRSAVTAYAFALDAARDDVECGIGALYGGTLRQLSGNGTELTVRYGELAAMLELARKVLSAIEIRGVIKDAVRRSVLAKEKPVVRAMKEKL